MDPNAAMRDALEAIQADDHPLAIDRLLAVIEWTKRGGFPPSDAAVKGAREAFERSGPSPMRPLRFGAYWIVQAPGAPRFSYFTNRAQARRFVRLMRAIGA